MLLHRVFLQANGVAEGEPGSATHVHRPQGASESPPATLQSLTTLDLSSPPVVGAARALARPLPQPAQPQDL